MEFKDEFVHRSGSAKAEARKRPSYSACCEAIKLGCLVMLMMQWESGAKWTTGGETSRSEWVGTGSFFRINHEIGESDQVCLGWQQKGEHESTGIRRSLHERSFIFRALRNYWMNICSTWRKEIDSLTLRRALKLVKDLHIPHVVKQ